MNKLNRLPYILQYTLLSILCIHCLVPSSIQANTADEDIEDTYDYDEEYDLEEWMDDDEDNHNHQKGSSLNLIVPGVIAVVVGGGLIYKYYPSKSNTPIKTTSGFTYNLTKLQELQTKKNSKVLTGGNFHEAVYANHPDIKDRSDITKFDRIRNAIDTDEKLVKYVANTLIKAKIDISKNHGGNIVGIKHEFIDNTLTNDITALLLKGLIIILKDLVGEDEALNILNGAHTEHNFDLMSLLIESSGISSKKTGGGVCCIPHINVCIGAGMNVSLSDIKKGKNKKNPRAKITFEQNNGQYTAKRDLGYIKEEKKEKEKEKEEKRIKKEKTNNCIQEYKTLFNQVKKNKQEAKYELDELIKIHQIDKLIDDLSNVIDINAFYESEVIKKEEEELGNMENNSKEYKTQQKKINSLKKISNDLKKAIKKAGLPEKEDLYFYYLLKGDRNFFQTWNNKKAKTFVESYTQLKKLEEKIKKENFSAYTCLPKWH